MKIDRFKDGYDFLSNFHERRFWYKNILWETSEHPYQWEKSTDDDEQEEIRCAPTPGIAKKLGRAVKHLRQDWEQVKLNLMYDIVKAKFEDPELRQMLLDTKEYELIEGNTWHDNYWGDCQCGRPKCQTPGENHLGKTLMKIRSEIRDASNTGPI